MLGSHNSWSYMSPMQWWLRPFKFMAKCQSTDIRTQYEKYGVRCFDLRIMIDKVGIVYCGHGIAKYAYITDILSDLKWLNEKKDCYVRVLFEARRNSQYNERSIAVFKRFCDLFEARFPDIKFWCGKNLYNWETDYKFSAIEPTCKEMYSSVCSPKWLDDWWPWLYAKFHNKKNIDEYNKTSLAGEAKQILLIDFVNIQ